MCILKLQFYKVWQMLRIYLVIERKVSPTYDFFCKTNGPTGYKLIDVISVFFFGFLCLIFIINLSVLNIKRANSYYYPFGSLRAVLIIVPSNTLLPFFWFKRL